MLVNETLEEYVKDVSSSKPAPGGGSVSALVASLGVALSSMVYNLTIGRKFYEEYDSDIKDEIESGLKICERLISELMPLVDEDKNAYDDVIKAIKMPKNNDEEKALRSQKLDEAYLKAINVPLKLARLLSEGFAPTLLIAQYGNPNAISDAAVGALLLFAGLQSAAINVRVNAKFLKDKSLADSAIEECENLIKRYEPVKDEILSISIKNL
ncbi:MULTISPECIES: cyclodeaminase/cyclohydrolase family protein [Thermoanaerobacterium]|uniref:Methenyltetrahydrofolate cyclohydrolase n=1 Tax=Thermoanaerobacterium xylanolyticum (strain ATCC 49914 / DSM 7097 / LX-11) TaxID=858215 RepID=F6BJL3_THEXL|nr:cyclodeaminase/cyclohydrolase family protein [Thermoanaerobacterium xylanolyticum]AEF17959.1 Methenyltetrahydrofolate cyclohydrolase [Thermoanaerobacterium xylanolyticum LX-11]